MSGTAFDRTFLRSVMRDLKDKFPQVQPKAAGLTFSRMGRGKHYMFQYQSFAWDGVADNAYVARAKAWCAFMDRQDTLAA